MEVRIPSSAPGLLVKSDEGGLDLDEDFEIYSSSDEDADGGKKPWEPAPERIVELYNQISKGQIPELIWRCPGRREPSMDGDEEEDMDESLHLEEETEKPTAFDFDSMFSEPSQPIGQQRKAVGTLKVQQKRVARLDKILNDMKKDTTVFQLQSPRVPYQSMSRSDNLPGMALFSDESVKMEDGIPFPGEYTFTSPPPSVSRNEEMDSDIKPEETKPSVETPPVKPAAAPPPE